MRNRPRTATPAVQTYIEEQADDLDLPTGASEENIDEPNQPTEPEPELDDDGWLDELTPYQAEQQVSQQVQTLAEPKMKVVQPNNKKGWQNCTPTWTTLMKMLRLNLMINYLHLSVQK